MSPNQSTVAVPDEIARQIVLPEGHLDEPKLFAAYRWLRMNAPLARAEVPGYDPLWLVSKHADIREVERQPEIFHNGGGENPGSHNSILATQAGDAWTKEQFGTLRTMESLQLMDGQEHQIVRGIAVDWFRPAQIKRWDDRIRQLARRQIAERMRIGHNELDFSRDFAWYYPLNVVMTLFGVPSEDEPLVMRLAHEHFGNNDPNARRADVSGDPATLAAKQRGATIGEFKKYYEKMVYRLREEPQDNLASLIANARQEDGSYFPLETCVGYYITISGAGHDTTATTLATGFEQLARNPEMLRRLQADMNLLPGFINETLRWASPVKHFVHQASEDHEVQGQTIRKGDRLMLLFQSANRDEDMFENPDVFDFERKPNHHIAFGSGPHACLGQNLARQELRIIFEELLPRISDLEPAGERKLLQTNFVGGLTSLPVRFELS